MDVRNTTQLGSILLKEGLISEEQLQSALRVQFDGEKNGRREGIGRILVHAGAVTEEQVQYALSYQTRHRHTEKRTRAEVEHEFGRITYQPDNSVTNRPFVEPQYENDVLVGQRADGDPVIMVTDRFKSSHSNQFTVIHKRVKDAYTVDHGKTLPVTVISITQDLLKLYKTMDESAPDELKSAYEQEFENLIKRAYEAKAVDLHFLRKTDVCRVRFRVFGTMRDHTEWDVQRADDIISVGFTSFGRGGKYSHWKSNIRQRIRLKIRYSQHVTLDCRYEHAPGDDGAYHACIRILANDRRDVTKTIDLTALGFTKAQTEALESAASSASGMVLLSGPTGSGKSTTMAGLIKYINRNDDVNILTVESPIERELPAFQTSVSDDDDADPLEFANAVKSCLRRDPDCLGLGEIRDKQSAEAAATGVQTGHILISSVHAQSALEIIERLTSPALGLPIETISSPSFLRILAYQVLMPRLADATKIRITSKNVHEYLQESEIGRLSVIVPDLDAVNVCVRGVSDEFPEGIGGMTICAEIVEPDAKLRKLFRELDLGGAVDYLKQLSKSEEGKPLDERCLGMSAAEHAIQKMYLGQLDPRDVELYFGHFNKLDIA